MAKFFALTSAGLVEALEEELHFFGLSKTQRTVGGVYFETNWRGCYLANLCSRIATRVVLPVLDFPAYQPDDIYHNLKKHDFTKYINVDQTLAVDAKVLNSKLTDQRLVALKAKDAIVDQFREKFERRPNVDKQDADMWIFIRVVKNQVTVSVDTSGGPLFKRGYREKMVDAPMKEHLGAGLLKMTSWHPEKPLVDLMCGSGTFLIEAGLMGLSQAPGVSRKKFAFQNFKNFQADVFDETLNSVLEVEKEENENLKLVGFDINSNAVKAARTNVRSAGLEGVVDIQRASVDLVKNPFPEETGVVVANPPYGERLGSVETLKDVYRDLGYTLKKEFKGWEFWVLSGESELTYSLGMKATLKRPVKNGPIDCRWIKYEIR